MQSASRAPNNNDSGRAGRFAVKKWGCVLKLSVAGAVEEVLLDLGGERVATVSAAVEHDGKLFLGNLGGDFVSVLSLE